VPARVASDRALEEQRVVGIVARQPPVGRVHLPPVVRQHQVVLAWCDV
jgi:hypothetical protein